MRLLTVVGNRPQFIKSAPLSLSLREAGIEEIVVHTGQHWDPGLSAVFFEELGLDEPAVALDLRTSEVAAIEAALREVVEARAAGCGPRLRRHQLHARGRPRRGPPPGRARRGRVEERRPRDARGAEQDRGGRALRLPLRPRRTLGQDAPGGGCRRRDPRRRRRHGGRRGAVRPARARALDDSHPARPRAGSLRARDGAPRGERPAGAPATHRGWPRPSGAARSHSRSPPDGGRARGAGHRAPRDRCG